ncbi:hypothetical protein [Burkholderia sp. Se-20378]|uniref:hypothetical protein n=1 Tax=Burkholderia sp. Se-20378 TaxID=2703899 RepID=UPI0019813FA6|nr:hypothetical protein [Burkholderia sp. Se-20378]MBN3768108.1 hypothetical protein [Burkholderia sp. Se-20378]
MRDSTAWHSWQNLAPGGFSEPHRAQRIKPSSSQGSTSKYYAPLAAVIQVDYAISHADRRRVRGESGRAIVGRISAQDAGCAGCAACPLIRPPAIREPAARDAPGVQPPAPIGARVVDLRPVPARQVDAVMQRRAVLATRVATRTSVKTRGPLPAPRIDAAMHGTHAAHEN